MSDFDFFLSMFTRVFPYLFLILVPFRNYLRCRKSSAFLLCMLFFFTSSLMVYMLIRAYGADMKWITPFTLGFLLCCFVLARSILRASLAQVLFLLLIVENYSDIVLLFSEIFAPALSFTQMDSMHCIFLARAIICLLTYPLMWYFLTRQVRPIWENSEDPSFWKYLWMLPGSFYLIYRLGIDPNFNIAESDTASPLLLALIWTFGTFLSYFSTLMMIQSSQDNQKLQQQLQVREYQTLIQNKQAERLAASIEITRHTRHDLHHYLLTLKTYIEQGDIQRLNESLNQFINNFESSIKTPVCAHLLISAVIRYYMDMATEHEITFTAHIDVPAQVNIRDEDLTVLLGNLLENAIEACLRQPQGEERFIEVKGGIQGKNGLVFVFRNSFSGKIHQEGDSFFSSKREGAGIGVTSVRSLCEQYHGVSRFTYEGGQFVVSLLLNPD